MAQQQKTSRHGWEEIIGKTAAAWQQLELNHAGVAQLAGAYQKWQTILAPASASMPFDATPIDFMTALRANAQIEAGPLLQSGQESERQDGPQTNTSLLELDLTTLRTMLRKASISSYEVTKLALERLEAVGKKTNACVAIDYDDALKQAKRADERLGEGQLLGPLHGVPLAHKDLFYQSQTKPNAGWCGIQPRSVRPDSGTGHSFALAQLDQAGAINLGRLHMTEFAFDPSGLNSELGPCHNPWNLNCVPGGSSSGSAVVVASRAVFGALGSDTGGSIRIPASLCGITGLKPTFGLVSTKGAMPLSHSNDHIGPLARTAADCAAMMQAIIDPVPFGQLEYQALLKNFEVIAKGAVGDLTGLRIGVPTGFFLDGMDSDIKDVIEESLKLFLKMGASVHQVSSDAWEALNAFGAVMTRVEAAARVARLQLIGGINPEVMTRFEQGVAIPGAFYVQALNERGKSLRTFLNTVMNGIDILHLPVCRIQTPSIEAFEGDAEHASYLRAELTILNRTFNYLGLPGLSLPAGFVNGYQGQRMPVGIQLVGRPYADARLLAIGAAWQRVTNWHREMPKD